MIKTYAYVAILFIVLILFMQFGTYIVTNNIGSNNLRKAQTEEITMTYLNEQFSTINAQFSIINAHLIKNDRQFNSLKNLIQQDHDFNADRMEYGKSISAPFKENGCEGTATKFALVYKEHATFVTVKHTNCSAVLGEINKLYITCPNIDIAFSRTCPTTEYAFDGTIADYRLGNPVALFGFSSVSHVFGGTIGESDPIRDYYPPNPEWHQQSIERSFEISIDGDVRPGHSGGLLINGKGGIAVIHGVDRSGMEGQGIPLNEVLACADSVLDQLKLVSDCPKIIVSKPPIFESD